MESTLVLRGRAEPVAMVQVITRRVLRPIADVEVCIRIRMVHEHVTATTRQTRVVVLSDPDTQRAHTARIQCTHTAHAHSTSAQHAAHAAAIRVPQHSLPTIAMRFASYFHTHTAQAQSTQCTQLQFESHSTHCQPSLWDSPPTFGLQFFPPAGLVVPLLSVLQFMPRALEPEPKFAHLS